MTPEKGELFTGSDMPRRYYFEPPQRRPKAKAGAGLKTLLVRCPSTAKLIDTGRTVEEKSWPTTKMKRQKLTCTHCGAVHSWTKEDVVLGRPLA